MRAALMNTAAAGLAMAAAACGSPVEHKDGEDLMKDVKQNVDTLMKAWEEYKSTNDKRLGEIEKKGSADALHGEKLANLEKAMAKGEELSAKLLAVETAQKKAAEDYKEMEEAFAKMQAKAGRPGAGGADELKQLVNHWVRGVISAHTVGVVNLPEAQRKVIDAVQAEYKALSITPDTAGGYLAPKEFVAEITKGVTEVSPVRQLVRVRTTAMKSVTIPKRTGQFAARRVAEQGTKTETTGLSYGLDEIFLPEVYSLIDVSNQMLEDSAFDMEAELRFEATEQFAVKEGQEFVSGTAPGECEGILSASANIATTNSGTAATIADADGQANGLLTLKHSIKSAYARAASWTLNRTTLGSVRKLKDGDKNYIWMPGIANGKPNTIDGDPYVECPDMPNEAAGAKPIAYGDFRRAYTLVDRIVMEMLRDPYTQATAGNVRFIFRKRSGGAVVLKEAIAALKCST